MASSLPSVPNETLAAAFSWPEPPSAWAERTYVPFGLHGVRSWIHRRAGRRRRTTAQQARLEARLPSHRFVRFEPEP